jgi:DNA repair protein RecO (recombination protein O)
MGPLRCEAVVIRSLRYGEADRILHIYTKERGRIAGIAKGARRLHSRLGGRLEPYQLVVLDLHQGRSQLLTVTGAQLICSNAGLRQTPLGLDLAARCCDAVGRLFATEEPHPEVFNLLSNLLLLLNRRPQLASWSLALSFHLKLLVAAGISPRVGGCVACGQKGAAYFSAAAGGTLCKRCVAVNSGPWFRFSAESRAFIAAALGRPLAQAPPAQPRALREVERAVVGVAAYHGHVRLLPTFGYQHLAVSPAEVAA